MAIWNQAGDFSNALTERELDILRLMAVGFSNREIASALYLGTGTVKWYTKQIYSKLGVHNRTQAARYASSHGLLQGDSACQAVAHNFPTETAPFFGRSHALAGVLTRLRDTHCHLLTLTGPGGIGKTRLALAAAHALLPYVPDGAYFVSLQSVGSPDDMLYAITSALQLSLHGKTSPQTQLAQYLSGKSLLLILDNVEHLLAGVESLLALLGTCVGVKMLVTSREALNLRDEWRFPLDGLAYPADADDPDFETYGAVQLFVSTARRVQPGFSWHEDRAAIHQICKAVDGMPLALELAAGWLKQLSCSAIATALTCSLDILETRMRDVPPRHRSMRAVFEPSWSLLSEHERNVLQALSVFRGGCSLEAAVSVADTSLRTLSTLVDRSLVRVDPQGRYDLHELIRQYAEEHLKAAPALRDAALARHASYFRDFLRAQWKQLTGAEQVDALDTMETEFDNVRFAWRFLIEKDDFEGILGASNSLWYFADIRSHFQEAWELFDEAIAKLTTLPLDQWTRRVLGCLQARRGWFYLSLGYPAKSRVVIEDALDLLRRTGDLEETLVAVLFLCHPVSALQDSRAARQYASEAFELARRSGNRWAMAFALYWKAGAHILESDLGEAQRLAQESRHIAQAVGDPWLTACVAGVLLGRIALDQGNLRAAREHFEHGLTVFRRVGNLWGQAYCHQKLGDIASTFQATDDVEQHYREAGKRFQQFNDLQWRPVGFILDRTQKLIAEQRFEEAAEMLGFIRQHRIVGFTSNPDPKSPEAFLAAIEKTLPLAHDVFLAAIDRGRKRDVRTTLQQLFPELPDDDQVLDLAYGNGSLLEKPHPSALTKREREVLVLVARGLSNREIAVTLTLAVGTVKRYIHQIFMKLDVVSRTQSVARARELNLLD